MCVGGGCEAPRAWSLPRRGVGALRLGGGGLPPSGGARRARQDARRRAGGPPPILPDEETEDVGDRAEQQLQRPQPREG